MSTEASDAGPDMPPTAPAPAGGRPFAAAETVPAGTSRRNYILGVINGTVGTVAYDFIHPDLILTGLVFALTLSTFGDTWAYFLVAMVSIINKGGSLLPQLYVSSMLEHRPRKRPFYILLTFVRGFGAAMLLVAMWLLASRVDWLTLGLFFAAFLIVSVCMGAGYVVTLDMFGRMIRMERIGSFLGTREFLGGAFSLVAGLVIVQPILSRGAAAHDNAILASNYFWLGLIGSTLTVVAMVFLIMCHEEEGPRAKHRTTLVQSLIRGWRWVKRNPDYRAYLWLRIAFRFNDLGMTFFIPYGVQKLRSAGPGSVVVLGGILVATFKLSRVVMSGFWGWTVDHYGDRVCLIGTGLCFVLAPSLALLAPLLPPVFGVPIPLTTMELDLPLVIYLMALVVIGAAYQGSIIGGNRFLIGRAPPRRRLSYIGFLNTITSPLTLLPLAAATIADRLGITTLFVLIVCGGFLYLFWALRVRPDTQPAVVRGEPSAAEAPTDGV